MYIKRLVPGKVGVAEKVAVEVYLGLPMLVDEELVGSGSEGPISPGASGVHVLPSRPRIKPQSSNTKYSDGQAFIFQLKKGEKKNLPDLSHKPEKKRKKEEW